MMYYIIRDPGSFHPDTPLCVALISWSKVKVFVSGIETVAWTKEKKKSTYNVSGRAMLFKLWVMTR